MGMFGLQAPLQRPVSALPDAVDPYAAMTAGPKPQAMQAPMQSRRAGMFGQLLSPFAGQGGSRNLQIIGATLRQLAHPMDGQDYIGDLLKELQAQEAQRMQANWQSTLQQRQVGEWNTQDKLVASAPDGMRGLAAANPSGYADALMSNLTRSHMRPATAAERSAYGIRLGTSLMMDEDGNPHVLQAPAPINQWTMGGGQDAPQFVPQPAGVGPGQPVTVQTPADAQALPPGTHYVTPDGQEYIR